MHMGHVSVASSEVFTAAEIARAAGVPVRAVRDLIRGGSIEALPGGFVASDAAVSAVQHLSGSPIADATLPRQLFAPAPSAETRTGLPLVASMAAHGAVFLILALAATLGATSPAVSQPAEFKPVRMVFLAIPGPGGGGGGGGLRQPAPARKAQLQGTNRMRSPVPVTRAIKSDTPKPAPRQCSASCASRRAPRRAASACEEPGSRTAGCRSRRKRSGGSGGSTRRPR